MRPIKARSRRPMTVVVSIASAGFGRVEHRRLAAPHDMAWPAHGGGRIGRHDLADHHPIEQVTQRGQPELCGRRGSRSAQLLDVGGDMHALDRRELCNARRLKPIEEFRRGARIGAARVRVLICAVKNSRKRQEARSPITATSAGTRPVMGTSWFMSCVSALRSPGDKFARSHPPLYVSFGRPHLLYFQDEKK